MCRRNDSYLVVGNGSPFISARVLFIDHCRWGGSNGYRLRLWKVELQKLANELALPIHVCHLPPGTSKWNKIEHRLFAFITQNWRGKPLVTHHVIVELIAATTTQAGLTVRCRLDERTYPKGKRISDQQRADVNLVPAAFHGEWNYAIHPTFLPVEIGYFISGQSLRGRRDNNRHGGP
jgi:hypothetical protein